MTPQLGDRGATSLALAISAAIALIIPLAVLATLYPGQLPTSTDCPSQQPKPAPAARRIPPAYLKLYIKAGKASGIGWNILAAIGSIESDHGRNARDSPKGARGPMQFLPSTWHDYGVDGNNDGHADITSPADAIPSAANYLKHAGAPDHLRQAIFTYNHSSDYVDAVLDRAATYATTTTGTAASCTTTPSTTAAPTTTAAKVIAYAKAQIGKPYVYGAEGPNSFDCSGLTMMAYRAAGITIPRTADNQYWHGKHIANGTQQPGDLAFFHMSRTGPGHVGIVYDTSKHTVIVAPHTGTVVQTQNWRRIGGLVGFTRPSAATS